jgi:putative ABC transport system substrate-binding protein
VIGRRAAAARAGVSLLPLPKVLSAQPAPHRVGVLAPVAQPTLGEVLQVLHEGLRAQGLEPGRDVLIEVRHSDQPARDLDALAVELAAWKPTVVAALGPAATERMLNATAAAPMPIVSFGDLVAAGHADQLGRPGGRVTGLSFLPLALNAKRLELLAELLPRGSVVLNLTDPTTLREAVASIEQPARQLGVIALTRHVATAAEVDRVFALAPAQRVAGINVLASPFLHGLRALIIEQALRARLPTIFQWPETAREGGLLGYGPSYVAMSRQLVGYVVRILRGAKPSDLPIEQPTKIELAVNLRTARAIGVTLPRTLLLRADEVIE